MIALTNRAPTRSKESRIFFSGGVLFFNALKKSPKRRFFRMYRFYWLKSKPIFIFIVTFFYFYYHFETIILIFFINFQLMGYFFNLFL